jgi:hypothetical protein
MRELVATVPGRSIPRYTNAHAHLHLGENGDETGSLTVTLR